jgi:muramidase (phage lysozyme)
MSKKDQLCQFVNFGESSNIYNMKYKIIKEEDKLEQFQQSRIDAFDEIENEIKSLIKPLRQAKIETVKYYRQDEPKSYSVVYGTDLIKDYIKDIKTLLEK